MPARPGGPVEEEASAWRFERIPDLDVHVGASTEALLVHHDVGRRLVARPRPLRVPASAPGARASPLPKIRGTLEGGARRRDNSNPPTSLSQKMRERGSTPAAIANPGSARARRSRPRISPRRPVPRERRPCRPRRGSGPRRRRRRARGGRLRKFGAPRLCQGTRARPEASNDPSRRGDGSRRTAATRKASTAARTAKAVFGRSLGTTVAKGDGVRGPLSWQLGEERTLPKPGVPRGAPGPAWIASGASDARRRRTSLSGTTSVSSHQTPATFARSATTTATGLRMAISENPGDWTSRRASRVFDDEPPRRCVATPASCNALNAVSESANMKTGGHRARRAA